MVTVRELIELLQGPEDNTPVLIQDEDEAYPPQTHCIEVRWYEEEGYVILRKS